MKSKERETGEGGSIDGAIGSSMVWEVVKRELVVNEKGTLHGGSSGRNRRQCGEIELEWYFVTLNAIMGTDLDRSSPESY